MVRNKKKVEISRLEYLALKYAESDMTDEEIRSNDITKDVNYEIDKMFESKEVINIAITGQVASGKSIVMEKFVWDINERLHKKPKVVSKM